MPHRPLSHIIRLSEDALELLPDFNDRISPVIRQEPYCKDLSFQTTLTLFLLRRQSVLTKEAFELLRVPHPTFINTRDVEAFRPEERADMISDLPNRFRLLDADRITYLPVMSNRWEAFASFLDNHFLDLLRHVVPAPHNAERLEGIEAFVRSNTRLRTRIYRSEENAIVFAAYSPGTHSPLEGWHYLQVLLPTLCPWFFRDCPLDEFESSLLLSLTSADPAEYIALVQKFLESGGYAETRLRNLLGSFRDASEANKLRDLKREVQSIQNGINVREEELRTEYLRLQERQYTLTGLEMSLEERKKQPSELEEFFLSSDRLKLIDADRDGSLVYEVRATLDNFDPDLYARYQENPGSCLNSGSNNCYPGGVSVEDGRRFMDAVFDTGELRVWMGVRFALDFSNRKSKHAPHIYSSFLKDCAKNPHFTHYECFGNSNRIINDALFHSDYLAAVTQTISCAGNLNLAETHNIRNFLCDLWVDDCKAVELPDGSRVTMKEAVQWLKEHQ